MSEFSKSNQKRLKALKELAQESEKLGMYEMTDKTVEQKAEAMAAGYCMVFSDTQNGTELDHARRQAYISGYAQGAKDALRWIPVTERLPEVVGPPLIVIQGGDWEGAYMFATFHNGIFYNAGRPLASITHWLPLPPKSEGK